MNGIHDMGGMHGMGPILKEKNEPVFHQEWEGRIVAIKSGHGSMAEVEPGRLSSCRRASFAC